MTKGFIIINFANVTFISLQTLDGNILRRGENRFHIREDVLCGDEANSYAQNRKAYQLYTLYHDKNGKLNRLLIVLIIERLHIC